MSSEIGPAGSLPPITELLTAWRAGDANALDELVPQVDAELRRLAATYLRRERPGHILQTTALINETYVRLLNWQGVTWQNRAHFLAMAARLMRHILVDLARQRAHGAHRLGFLRVDLDAAEHASPGRSRDLVALDDALCELAERDARKARIVELRFFGGMTLPEIAEAMDIAPITVSREWAKARAWLHREIAHTPDPPR